MSNTSTRQKKHNDGTWWLEENAKTIKPLFTDKNWMLGLECDEMHYKPIHIIQRP